MEISDNLKQLGYLSLYLCLYFRLVAVAIYLTIIESLVSRCWNAIIITIISFRKIPIKRSIRTQPLKKCEQWCAIRRWVDADHFLCCMTTIPLHILSILYSLCLDYYHYVHHQSHSHLHHYHHHNNPHHRWDRCCWKPGRMTLRCVLLQRYRGLLVFVCSLTTVCILYIVKSIFYFDHPTNIRRLCMSAGLRTPLHASLLWGSKRIWQKHRLRWIWLCGR